MHSWLFIPLWGRCGKKSGGSVCATAEERRSWGKEFPFSVSIEHCDPGSCHHTLCQKAGSQSSRAAPLDDTTCPFHSSKAGSAQKRKTESTQRNMPLSGSGIQSRKLCSLHLEVSKKLHRNAVQIPYKPTKPFFKDLAREQWGRGHTPTFHSYALEFNKATTENPNHIQLYKRRRPLPLKNLNWLDWGRKVRHCTTLPELQRSSLEISSALFWFCVYISFHTGGLKNFTPGYHSRVYWNYRSNGPVGPWALINVLLA